MAKTAKEKSPEFWTAKEKSPEFWLSSGSMVLVTY